MHSQRNLLANFRKDLKYKNKLKIQKQNQLPCRNASVVQFALLLYVDRCYAYVALARGLDFHILPAIHSRFLGTYQATRDNVAVLVTKVRELVIARGLQHLLRRNDEL